MSFTNIMMKSAMAGYLLLAQGVAGGQIVLPPKPEIGDDFITHAYDCSSSALLVTANTLAVPLDAGHDPLISGTMDPCAIKSQAGGEAVGNGSTSTEADLTVCSSFCNVGCNIAKSFGNVDGVKSHPIMVMHDAAQSRCLCYNNYWQTASADYHVFGDGGSEFSYCVLCSDVQNDWDYTRSTCDPATVTAGPVTGFGDPHYVCPNGEKFDFEGIEGKHYSLIKDAGLDIDVTYTTGDAAANTVAAARRLLGSAEEQNSVYTYMDSAKVTTNEASFILATNAPSSDNAFTLLDDTTGEHCVVSSSGSGCDRLFASLGGVSFSVTDTGPCKFHRPGRKLLPKGGKMAIRDRITDASCQELTVTSDAFSASFSFVPAGEMNGSAGVNYLDFALNSLSSPTDAVDGIVGQCFRPEFPERHAAFPDFLKTKFCDTCNVFEL